MGGVVGALLCLYCASGCQASVVASALAFHPPFPTYKFEEIEEEHERKYRVKFLVDERIDRLLGYNLESNLRVELLTTKNGTKVPVLLYKHPEATMTILFSHGNASDCGIMSSLFILIAVRLKVNVLAYDYTGYGASLKYGIRPTDKQTYQDITTVYEWAINEKIIQDPAKELIVYGQSVGSGPSCYLATKFPVAGLILHSPILSGLRVITDSRFLACFDIFPNIDRIKTISCPVFIMHGDQDEEVTINHGHGLHEAVPSRYQYPPWWVVGRGHNDIIPDNETEYLR